MSIKPRILSILNSLTPPALTTALEKLSFNRRILASEQAMQPYTKLHLACGTNIMEGWANIDLLAGAKVIRWNCTTRFPLKDNSISFIYTEHFVEHITMRQGADLFAECCRVLKPGGVLRISTPNLRKIIDEYLIGDASEWRNLKYSANTGPNYTPCRMVNDAMRMWGHEFVYDERELVSSLKKAGFSQVIPVKWKESTYKELDGLESRNFYDDVIVEATK